MLARFVWEFDFDVPEGGKVCIWEDQNIYWAWEKNGVEVELSLAKK